MGIAVTFDVSDMTAHQYEQVMADLAAQGLAEPPGRRLHVACPAGAGWAVFDIWDSPDSLQSFAEALMPALVGAGVTPPEPEIREIHNLVAALART